MKNIKRLISILLMLISIWIIWYEPFYVVAEYPGGAAWIISLVMIFSFGFGLSSFEIKNRALDNLRVVIIGLSVIGIFPGIYFNYKFFLRARYSFLLREGITNKAIVIDKNIGSSSSGRNNNVEHTYYELYFSFQANEKTISKSAEQVSEKRFKAVTIGDSLNVVYLPTRTDVTYLIISQEDSAFYAAKLKPIR